MSKLHFTPPDDHFDEKNILFWKWKFETSQFFFRKFSRNVSGFGEKVSAGWSKMRSRFPEEWIREKSFSGRKCSSKTFLPLLENSFWLEIFRQVCQSCILRVRRRKLKNIFSFLWVQNIFSIKTFGEKNSIRISRLHFMCLDEHFGQEKTLLKVFVLKIVSELWAQIFLRTAENFLRSDRNYNLLFQRKNLKKLLFIDNSGLSTISGLSAKKHGTLSFWQGCQTCTLCVQSNILTYTFQSEKKLPS